MRRLTLIGLLALAGCQESTTPNAPGGVAASPGPPATSPAPTDKADDQGTAANASTSPTSPPAPPTWPFQDPDKLAVITLTRILNGSKPILYVVHDEDGDWQFLDGDDVSEEDAETVAFKRVFELDRSLGELADLPNNWTAERAAVGKPWTRAPRN